MNLCMNMCSSFALDACPHAFVRAAQHWKTCVLFQQERGAPWRSRSRPSARCLWLQDPPGRETPRPLCPARSAQEAANRSLASPPWFGSSPAQPSSRAQPSPPRLVPRSAPYPQAEGFIIRRYQNLSEKFRLWNLGTGRSRQAVNEPVYYYKCTSFSFFSSTQPRTL